MTSAEAFEVVRSLCLAQDGAYEKTSHGSPCFFIEKGKQFAAFLNNHHGDGRLAVWLLAPLQVQAMLIEEDPETFFKPPYVGPKGWVGVILDKGISRDSLEGLIQEAAALAQPKKPKKS